MSTYLTPQMDLPWSSSEEEDARFRKILSVLSGLFLVASIIVTLMNVPALTRAEKEELPPQLARVLLEKQVLPPVKPVEPPKPEEKPVEKKPEPKPKPIKAAPVEKPTERTKDEVLSKAKDKAQEKFSTFKDDLQEMRETLQSTAVETAATTVTNSDVPATQVDRSMINSGVTRGSGGINVGAYASHDTGGKALSGTSTTKVKSSLAEAGKKAAGASGNNSDGAGGAARSEEEVRKVMEQHKAAIFNIYNRALRDNAALQGKVVVKMVIDPSGQIVEATIVSSGLKDPELEAKLLARIKLISFAATNVTRTTLNYSFDFLPQ